MARVFVGVGSNIEPADNVRRAVRLLVQEMRVINISTVYETKAEGRREQPPYYNCVVEVESEAPPAELKRSLRAIEDRLGRVRREDKYGPRSIDLDVLIYDDVVMQSEEIVLPDPDIAARPHLCVALAELAPSLTLPGTEMTISALAEEQPEEGMNPLDEYTAALRKEAAHGG